MEMNDVRRLLSSTSITTLNVLKNKLILAIRLGDEYNEKKLSSFLKTIETKFFEV